MTRNRFYVLFLGLTLVACGGAPPVDEEVSSGEGELRKKVSPQGSKGTFQLVKPAWATAAFDDALTFAGNPIKLGDTVTKPPGSYPLALASSTASIEVKAGAAASTNPAGLHLRYDQPVDASWFASDQIVVEGPSGHLIRAGAQPLSVAVIAAQYKVQTTSFSWSGSLTAGALTELVVPTATLVVVADSIDPTYPSAMPDCLRMRALRNDIDIYPNYTASRWSVSPAIRALSPTTAVPGGNAVRLTMAAALGWDRARSEADLATYPVAIGTTTTVTVNRLEVDDVAPPNPADPKIKGTFSVDLKRNGSWTPYVCARSVATHTGVDVPDGTYRVTTTAPGPNGTITHVEEMSFP